MDTLIDGLGFLEGPRWHDGKLFFSDFVSRKVQTTERDTVLEVPGIPSGLGWLPDGTLLVVSMEDRKIVRGDGSDYADLSAFAPFECNDMVVDANGNAYVGQFGFDYSNGAPPVASVLILVTPDRSVRAVADELMFPNGMVISPDGKTLIVGETYAARMTAFDIGPDATLSNRRVFAQLEGAVPDGCCLDAEGALWIASPVSNEVIRMHEGGEVTHRLSTGDRNAIACMLGGDDRRTLFVLASLLSREPGSGAILTERVDVPGAGLP
jgi:sugar lactone lactonase YvrE